MKNSRLVLIAFGCIVTLLFLYSFRFKKKDVTLNIQYTLNYEGDNWQKNRTGLLWTLSYLGAGLPENSLDKSIMWINKQVFQLNFNGLGFNEEALEALAIIADSLKQTEIYKKRKYVDLGHFISITLGSSWHYYAITGVPKTYTAFLNYHQIKKFETLPLTRSAIANHHRVLKIATNDSVLNSVFIAEEGPGNVTDSTFEPTEFEVMDIMKNGQLRVMVYNLNGELKVAGNKSFSGAGKPAKCIWCHETEIPALLTKPDTIKGYLTPGEFAIKIEAQNNLLNEYRKTLKSEIDFLKKQDHTYQELVYIGFMEPSLKKLSQEWNLPEKQLKKLFATSEKHIYHEFPFLGELLYRSELSGSPGFGTGSLPLNIREEMGPEPNYFKSHE